MEVIKSITSILLLVMSATQPKRVATQHALQFSSCARPDERSLVDCICNTRTTKLARHNAVKLQYEACLTNMFVQEAK
eukprot:5119889-Amphidinium_carterae.1